MRRLFWMALGATGGVLLVRRVSRAAQAYTPAGVASGLGDGLRDLAAAVREGMGEREAELRTALGMDTGTLATGTPMDAEAARRLVEDPTGRRAL
jgi:hypothetical protein